MLDFDIGGGSAGWVEYKPARAAWRMPDDSGSVEDVDWKQAIFHFEGIRMGGSAGWKANLSGFGMKPEPQRHRGLKGKTGSAASKFTSRCWTKI